MKTRSTTYLRSALGFASALAMLAYSGSAQAAGVKAGVIIESTASATFTTGGTGGNATSNTVQVRVDELIDVSVNGLNSAPASAGTDTVISWEITNSGNGNEAFKIDATVAAGGTMTPIIKTVAIDTNNNGIYDAGIDQIITNGSLTPELASDTALRVFVIASVPAGALPDQTGAINLTATAATGSGTPGTVLAGAGDGGTNAVIGVNTATNTDASTITVSATAGAADVALVKTGTVNNQFSSNQPVPSATITYTIDVVVTKGSATNLVVTDPIPTGTTYQYGTLKLNGTLQSDAVDAADKSSASQTGISVNLGDVAAGAKNVISFDVKIN